MLTLAVAPTAAFPLAANGQAPAGYPNKAIRFVVPYAPGGLPDTVARIVVKRLGERLGQSVISLKEFLDYVKSKPGQVNYGSSGIGSAHHLTMEALKAELGVNLVHVPFKGSGQSVPALIGGQVEVLWSAYPSLAGFVKDGRVKVLATNSAQRSPEAPNVPAIAEMIPGFDFAVIVGVPAPVGTPKGIIEKISAEVVAVTKRPDTQQALAAAGIEPVGGGSVEYSKAIAG